MGRTRTTTHITEEKLTVKQPNTRKAKLRGSVEKARANNNNSNSGDSSSDMELSPKSKKRTIAEVLGSDDEEQQIRPKAKKSRVAKPKASKSKKKNINNTNVIFDEHIASDDDFKAKHKTRVTRGSANDGDELSFTAQEECTPRKGQNKSNSNIKREETRARVDEPMSDLQHFVASDDEQEWEDVQWDGTMSAVGEIKREIKSEM